MFRFKRMLLAATVVGAGLGGAAYAQQASSGAPAYDPAQLPETHGKVAQYSLTPRGDVDGVILDDGTEVHFSPRESAALIYAVRPGDAVTVHGLKARAVPMVLAMSITNDATHQTVTGGGPGGHEDSDHATSDVTGQVKQALHSPRGDANGVLLADGTEVRLPPPEAAKLGDALAAGKTVFVRGIAITSPLGKLVMAREIGPDRDHLTRIAAAEPGMMERMMHGMMGHHGHSPGGPGGPGGHGEPDEDGPGSVGGPGGPGGPGAPPPPPAPPAQ